MKYHKIQTVYYRDPATNNKTLLEGQWSMPEFEYLKDNQWVWTEKIDGTNIRIKCIDDKVEFGGRTDNAQIPSFLMDYLTNAFSVDQFKDTFDFDRGSDVCLFVW